MEDIDLIEYWRVLKRHRWLIAGVTFVMVVSAFVVLFAWTPRTYQGKAVLLFPKQNDSASGLLAKLGGIQLMPGLGVGAMNSPGMYAEVLRSRTISENVIRDLDLDAVGVEPDRLQGQMAIDITKDGGMEICCYAPTTWVESGKLKWLDQKYPSESVKRKTAHLAADLTNAYILRLKDYENEHALGEGQRKRRFLVGEVAKTKSELTTAEDAFEKFREKHPMAPPPETLSDQVKQIIDLKTKQIEISNTLRVTEQSIAEAKRIIGDQQEVITAAKIIQENPVVADLKMQLAQSEVRRATLLEDLTDAHPDVVQIQQNIKQIQERIKAEVPKVISSETQALNAVRQKLAEDLALLEIQKSGAEAEAEAMDEVMARIEKEVSSLASVQMQYLRLARDVKVLEGVYSALLIELSQAKAAEAKEPGRFTVLDWAVPEKFHFKPRVKLVLLAVLLFGMTVGSLMAFVQEARRPAKRSLK